VNDDDDDDDDIAAELMFMHYVGKNSVLTSRVVLAGTASERFDTPTTVRRHALSAVSAVRTANRCHHKPHRQPFLA